MKESQPSPKHPLLSKEEFKEAVVAAGHTELTGGNLFNSLGRAQLRLWQARRGPEDIMYHEIPYGATAAEYFISIPNLRLHLRDLIDERQIIGKQVEAAALIVERLLPPDELDLPCG